MKTIATIVSITIVCVALLLGSAHSQTFDIDMIVMDDITDTMERSPEMNIMESYFDLDDDLWKGVQLEYVNLTDLGLNPSQKISLPKQRWWWNNELERRKTVAEFKADFLTLGKARNTQEFGKPKSALFASLLRELGKISKSDAEQRIVVIYSDLMQNTESVSFYDTATFAMVKRNPQLVREQLKQRETLPSLDDVVIYLVYQPTNRTEDIRFATTSAFYRSWFEELGATVLIQSNLSIVR